MNPYNCYSEQTITLNGSDPFISIIIFLIGQGLAASPSSPNISLAANKKTSNGPLIVQKPFLYLTPHTEQVLINFCPYEIKQFQSSNYVHNSRHLIQFVKRWDYIIICLLEWTIHNSSG